MRRSGDSGRTTGSSRSLRSGFQRMNSRGKIWPENGGDEDPDQKAETSKSVRSLVQLSTIHVTSNVKPIKCLNAEERAKRNPWAVARISRKAG